MKLDPDALKKAKDAIAAAYTPAVDQRAPYAKLMAQKAAADAILAYLTAREAQGWAERPREPTEAMVEAGGTEFFDAVNHHTTGDDANRPFRRYWRTMFDAGKA